MDYDTLHDHFELDEALWNELDKLDPGMVSSNCSITFDNEKKCYTIPVLDTEYVVFPDDRKIIELDNENNSSKNSMELELFLMHYLIKTSGKPLTGKHASEKELKGGEMFFRGPHALPIDKIVKFFGSNARGLIDAGIRMKGEEAGFGDASITLYPAPKTPVTYVLWTADEEFPASVTTLFDLSIQDFLPLDVIYGMCIYTYQKLTT